MQSASRAAIALAAAFFAAGPALAQTPPVGPSFLGSLGTLTASIGDTFTTQPAASANPLYNFTDVYTFTFTGPTGSASGSAISFASVVDSAITNLQAGVFALPSGQYAGASSFGTYLSSQGDTSGALDSWTTMSLGTGSATTFSTTSPLVNGTTYAIEIRGLIGANGASYGGNLVINSVPEPASLLTAALGLLAALFAARRARRQSGAA